MLLKKIWIIFSQAMSLNNRLANDRYAKSPRLSCLDNVQYSVQFHSKLFYQLKQQRFRFIYINFIR